MSNCPVRSVESVLPERDEPDGQIAGPPVPLGLVSRHDADELPASELELSLLRRDGDALLTHAGRPRVDAPTLEHVGVQARRAQRRDVIPVDRELVELVAVEDHIPVTQARDLALQPLARPEADPVVGLGRGRRGAPEFATARLAGRLQRRGLFLDGLRLLAL